MVVKGLLFAGVAAVCALAVPRGPEPATAVTADPTDRVTLDGHLPAPDQFLRLAQSDPVAMFEACVRRYKQEVRGFKAVLHKQERLKDKLCPPEVVRVAVREDPFAVQMIWDEGVRSDVAGTVYAAGENGGLMTVWRPSALILKTVPVNPRSDVATTASRYCVTDSSLSHAMYRSLMKWADAKARGELHYEFQGIKPVPEVGGRTCIVLHRTCVPDELDNFALDDQSVRNPGSDPAHAIHEITYFIDAQTWQQIGTLLKRADGQLVGSYFFRDVALNPSFPAGTFTSDGFKR
jgi:hypothetical protein